jgi:Tol biopolymer transport system component
MIARKLLVKALLICVVTAALIACSEKDSCEDSGLRGRLAIPSGRNLYVMDLKTGDVLQIQTRGAGTWSPDGRQLALSIVEQGSSWYADVVIHDVGSGESTTVASKLRFIDVPDWSPDGSWLTFMMGAAQLDSDRINVMAAKTDGSDLHSVANCGDRRCCCARWSGDGRRIAFASSKGIEVVDRDGGNRQRLYTREEGFVRELAWSPDNSKIAFIDDPDSAFIKLLDPESRQVSRLPVQDEFSGWSLAWSPTSDQLATVLFGQQEDQLLVIDLNGNELMNVRREHFSIGFLDWGPEP